MINRSPGAARDTLDERQRSQRKTQRMPAVHAISAASAGLAPTIRNFALRALLYCRPSQPRYRQISKGATIHAHLDFVVVHEGTARLREAIMRGRFSSSMSAVAIGVAVSIVMSVTVTRASAQAPTLKTPWGEPDLQGIWTDETDTPLQRSPKYANQEFFTEEQRAELDRLRSSMLGRERRS